MNGSRNQNTAIKERDGIKFSGEVVRGQTIQFEGSYTEFRL